MGHDTCERLLSKVQLNTFDCIVSSNERSKLFCVHNKDNDTCLSSTINRERDNGRIARIHNN